LDVVAGGGAGSYDSLVISGNNANSFLYSGAGGAVVTTTQPDAGQILIGTAIGSAPALGKILAGGGISIAFVSGNYIISTTTTGVGRPAGAYRSLQYNNSGNFGGDATLLYDVPSQSILLDRVVIRSELDSIGGFSIVGRSGSTTPFVRVADSLTFTAGGITTYLGAQVVLDGAVDGVDGAAEIKTAGTSRLTIDGTGAWKLGTDAGTSGQVLTSQGSSSPPVWKDTGVINVFFHYGDATPAPICTVPAGKVVLSARITILTAFDDAASTLSLGSSGVTFLTTTENSTSMVGTYTSEPGVQFSLNTDITLTITPGTSTAGYGLVSITLQE
jgi:hypothetical protein